MTEETLKSNAYKITDEELEKFVKNNKTAVKMLYATQIRFEKGLDIDDWECAIAEVLLKGINPPEKSPYYDDGKEPCAICWGQGKLYYADKGLGKCYKCNGEGRVPRNKNSFFSKILFKRWND